ncbi:sensor histidine kinase [Pseudoflavonifractor phocaeensis]|uniref:sensor histidine kinase n=1 Tax=Pseudoflavonifractor phocaeensis TaxID=1870988 RepID=UPI0019570B78|nr:HAMP domain-containing sensor histidine kinase [Pseudoflavonifractor phocaeensis]MBM6925896.1 HAMP domain-containing histidine kinase [Pseudoflavonifractor phocaeensis]
MEPVSEDLGLLAVEQFREQMNNLTAAVQLLTPVVREKAGPQYESYLAILHQSLYRMMRMVGNLEFLQLPEEELPVEEGSLDLAGLCRALCRQVEALAAQAGLNFSYEEETASLITRGDGTLLRRMLLCLFSNAFKAAGQEGNAGLRLAVRESRAILTVWDDGPGLLPPEPEETSLLSRHDGLGLGLRVARRIVARHGGTIVFEQREERGCRAVVSLPLIKPEGDGLLRTPGPAWDREGGFSDLMVELSAVLPYQAFLPADLEE